MNLFHRTASFPQQRDPSELLELRIAPLHEPGLRLEHQEQGKMPFHINLRSGELLASLPVATGSLVLIVDKSPSMRDNGKWDAVRDCVTAYLQTNPGIDVTLIAFDSDAEVLGQVQAGDRRGMEAIVRNLHALRLGGGTRIDVGLQCALDTLQHSTERVHIVLLTDGRSQQAHLTITKIPMLNQREITVSVIGTDDVDIHAMQQLTDATNGELGYVSRLSHGELLLFLQRHTQQAQNTVITNVRLALNLNDGVQLVEASKSYPDVITYPITAPFEARVGDLQRAEGVQFYGVVNYPMPGQDTRFEVAEAMVTFDVPQLGVRNANITRPLTLTLVASATPAVNGEVQQALQRTRMQRHTEAAANASTPDQAIQELSQALRHSQALGDARKTQTLASLIDATRSTNVVSSDARKTMVVTGRSTRIVGR